KAGGLAGLAGVVPGRNKVGNQPAPVHRLTKIALVKLAAKRPNPAQIRMRRSKNPKRSQPLALDQLRRRRRNDQSLVVFAEPFRPWRRAQANRRNVPPLRPEQQLLV